MLNNKAKEIISSRFFKLIANPSFSFIIYGFGELGNDIYKELSQFFNVISIIDKNKIGIQIDGIQIKSIDSLNDYKNIKNIVIVNTILDPFQSSEVRKNILDINIEWIILQLNEYLQDDPISIRAKILELSNSKMYLYEIGWNQSVKTGLPVTKDNLPLPWVTYSFIDFIAERLNKEMNLFEWGAGNSTFWYAEKVKSIVSVENNVEWFHHIKKKLPTNATIYYQELKYGGEYGIFPKTLNRKFNIMIIDGRDRVNCMKNSLSCLSDDGVIVLDDSERINYREGDLFLKTKGFKVISFWGLAPGVFVNKCTSLYYRVNNTIGL
jgi:hypothetical protein